MAFHGIHALNGKYLCHCHAHGKHAWIVLSHLHPARVIQATPKQRCHEVIYLVGHILKRQKRQNMLQILK